MSVTARAKSLVGYLMLPQVADIVAAARRYADSASPIDRFMSPLMAALASGTQAPLRSPAAVTNPPTTAAVPPPTAPPRLDAQQRRLARMAGMTDEQFLAELQAQAAAREARRR